jgi:hypothetical protein
MEPVSDILDLFARDQYWIQRLDSKHPHGFNLAKAAIKRLPPHVAQLYYRAEQERRKRGRRNRLSRRSDWWVSGLYGGAVSIPAWPQRAIREEVRNCRLRTGHKTGLQHLFPQTALLQGESPCPKLGVIYRVDMRPTWRFHSER